RGGRGRRNHPVRGQPFEDQPGASHGRETLNGAPARGRACPISGKWQAGQVICRRPAERQVPGAEGLGRPDRNFKLRLTFI
ncbi:hypothetical protein AB4084_30915, partial [Lysobacter sp. 2RAB21]